MGAEKSESFCPHFSALHLRPSAVKFQPGMDENTVAIFSSLFCWPWLTCVDVRHRTTANEHVNKSEIRNPKSEGIPKSEIRKGYARFEGAFSDFGIRISFGFRYSDFGFPDRVRARAHPLRHSASRPIFFSATPGRSARRGFHERNVWRSRRRSER